MGISVIVYGKSGSGKSRALKNFAPDEILLVNPTGKRLPFPGSFKFLLKSDDYGTIMKWLKTMPMKTAVIDDTGYLLTNAFMRGHSAPKSGSSSFDLYNNIADSFWRLLNFIQYELPDDVIVYINMHETSNDYGEVKLRTIGKLLDEKVCIEGLVTVCLRCMTDGTKHWFKTQSGGNDISKSPEDMFPPEIENDLKAVDSRIREYWGMTAAEEESQHEPV